MNKKSLYFFIIFLTLILIIFLNSKGIRYTGINYNVFGEKISNFQKINDLFERDQNYRELVKKINDNENNKKKQAINISRWVYLNIRKIKYDVNDDIIDSHPWTIVERRMGVEDQFSDILSVLFVYSNIDSFYISKLNSIDHPLTFFKYNDKWSLIDPYYGVYFLNNEDEFCRLYEHKLKRCFFYHLEFGKISENFLNTIFFNKNFKNLKELQDYYYFLVKNIPNSNEIDEISNFKRGGRSYIQKPFQRLIYQIQSFFNLIK